MTSQATKQLTTLLAGETLIIQIINNAVLNLKKKGKDNFTPTLICNRLNLLEENWTRCHVRRFDRGRQSDTTREKPPPAMID